MPNPYDDIVRRYNPEPVEEVARRRREAVLQRDELGSDPRRAVDAQRISRQEGRTVAPDEVPRARVEAGTRRLAEAVSQSFRLAGVFAAPGVGAALADEVDEQAGIARAVRRVPPPRRGAGAEIDINPFDEPGELARRTARYQFSGASSATIAAALDRDEEREHAGRNWFWRFMHTDIVRAATGGYADARPEVMQARMREDAERLDAAGGTLNRISALTIRGIAQAEAGIYDFAAGFQQVDPEDASVTQRLLGLVRDERRNASSSGNQALAEQGRAIAAIGRERDVTIEQVDEDFFSVNTLRFAGEQSLLSAPSLIASFFGRTGMAFNFGTVSGSVARSRAENQGREEVSTDDIRYAWPVGLASASLDRFSAGRVVNAVGGRTVRNRLVSIGQAAQLEALTEATQSVIEYTGGVVDTPVEWQLEDARKAALAGALVGFALGGGVRAGTEAADALVVRPTYQDARRRGTELTTLGDSEAQTEAVREILASSTRQMARTTDPEMYRQAIERQVEGTPIENIYIPIEALDEYLTSEGSVDPEGFFNSHQEQIAEARLTGGEVVFSLAEFATFIAGTPAQAALEENIRPGQAALTPRESATRRDEIMAEVEAIGAAVAAEAEGSDTPQTFEQTTATEQGEAPVAPAGETAPAEAAVDEPIAAPEAKSPGVKVYDDVLAQLQGIGVPADEARGIAKLVAVNRVTQAGNMGVSVEQYHADNPLEFRREGAKPTKKPKAKKGVEGPLT